MQLYDGCSNGNCQSPVPQNVWLSWPEYANESSGATKYRGPNEFAIDPDPLSCGWCGRDWTPGENWSF